VDVKGRIFVEFGCTMSSYEDLTFAVEQFSGKARLFPLPNLVLFPHVMQPVHIFEPRYRDMLEDALAGDRLVAMALLAPGWERNYEGRPALYPVACLGRIAACCRLADGTYNVLLHGLLRARLLYEVETKHRFREARVEIYEDLYPPLEVEQYDRLHDRLRENFFRVLPFMLDAREQLDQLLDADVPLGMLSDIVSFMLDIDPLKKELLLAEADVYRRTELLLKYLQAAINEHSGGNREFISFPPPFSSN
jgi:uncharacterized protein